MRRKVKRQMTKRRQKTTKKYKTTLKCDDPTKVILKTISSRSTFVKLERLKQDTLNSKLKNAAEKRNDPDHPKLHSEEKTVQNCGGGAIPDKISRFADDAFKKRDNDISMPTWTPGHGWREFVKRFEEEHAKFVARTKRLSMYKRPVYCKPEAKCSKPMDTQTNNKSISLDDSGENLLTGFSNLAMTKISSFEYIPEKNSNAKLHTRNHKQLITEDVAADAVPTPTEIRRNKCKKICNETNNSSPRANEVKFVFDDCTVIVSKSSGDDQSSSSSEADEAEHGSTSDFKKKQKRTIKINAHTAHIRNHFYRNKF